eukprot:Nitzschia sp. Nitz4//scaffold29_size155292//126625//127468//NITZ4_002685-RA/size155292-augustus-gene-0.214-mRNA-1//1//CDS//3329546529//2118//frame0
MFGPDQKVKCCNVKPEFCIAVNLTATKPPDRSIPHTTCWVLPLLVLAYKSQSSNQTAMKSPRFPEVLREMLEDVSNSELEDVVSWLPDGERFKVHDIQRFTIELMPKYFNHSCYKSFLRQLCLYQFKRGSWKTTPGPRGSYVHPYFQRDKPELLDQVTRMKSAPKVSKKRPISCTEKKNKPIPPSLCSTWQLMFEKKHLDPRPMHQSPHLSMDILKEIVNTFAVPSLKHEDDWSSPRTTGGEFELFPIDTLSF